MILHDLQCPNADCNRIQTDYALEDVNRLPACRDCGAAMEITYNTMRTARLVSVSSKERAVVWRNPKTGKVAYPPRNDAPIPSRYKNAGYERHEMPSLKSLDTFCKDKNLVNEKSDYNSGNGRD